MDVFLIQTSGVEIATAADPAYVDGTDGPRYCDEVLEHHRYSNAAPFWQEDFHRRRAWERASSGDAVLLYCTGSVDEFPRCLSHVCRIDEKRIVEGERARLEFDAVVGLASPIAYATIQDGVQRGGFSTGMGRVGRQGFNFRQVSFMDLELVRSHSPPETGSWDDYL